MQDTQETDPVLAEIVDTHRPSPHGVRCQSCGAPSDSRDQFCSSCGAPHTISADLVDSGTSQADVDGQQWFECRNCGSRVGRSPNQRSFTCPFCDSNYVVELPATSHRKPDFVIGFAVTSDQAHEKFRKWIRQNGWLRPGDLERSTLESKLVGVYLPFWCFSMLAQSSWSARIGEYWYRTERYTTTDSKGRRVTRTRTVRETEWWHLEGRHHRYHWGYLVSGSRGLSHSEANRIKPFQLPALKRYAPFYLAGWMSEEYSVSHDQALEICQDAFLDREYDYVRRFMPGDEARNVEVSTGFSRINADLCLLPVYIWSYRYKDKLYRFMVNGQTGRVDGDKPLSGRRITALIVFIVLIVVAIFVGLALSGAFR